MNLSPSSNPGLFRFACAFVFISSFMSAAITQTDCCGTDAGDRVKTIHIRYTGHLCSDMAGSNHNQTAGVVCENYYPTLPMPDTVLIEAHDAQGSQTSIIWFEDAVLKNEVFVVSGLNHPDSSAAPNKKVIGPALELLIYNKAGDSLFQKIEFHTSCSQPIAAGNQFGSALITYINFKNNYDCGDINEGLLDFGDAPNEEPNPYPTKLLEDGPAHNLAFAGPYFGVTPPDQEPDGIADLDALGDDAADLPDDEDGVSSSLVFLEGDPASVTLDYINNTGSIAYISAWLDLEGDGFDADDKQMISVPANSGGSVTLNFGTVPANNLDGTFLRIRISTDQASVQDFTGIAPDGEIEDHFVDIQQPLFSVELADFNANKKNNQIELRWTTLSETNNDHFQVQRSIDGFKFITFTTVKGAGTSQVPLHYQIMDLNPGANKLFYRLNQVDLDGTSTMSKVIQVVLEKTEASVKLYPNPASDLLQVDLTGYSMGIQRIQLFNLLGQIVYDSEYDGAKLTQLKEQVDVSLLAPGIYLLKVTDRQNQHTAHRLRVDR